MQVPFLAKPDIERFIEEEIARSSMWSDAPYHDFDVEVFLQEHLKVLLDKDCSLPDDTMGEVIFPRRNQRVRVNVNRQLTESAEKKEFRWSLARWRMTIAHECAHVILHGPLFRPVNEKGVPLDSNETRTHRCHKQNLDEMGASDDVRKGRSKVPLKADYEHPDGNKVVQALEFQANYAAAVLLMPRSAFVRAAKDVYEYYWEAHNQQHSLSKIQPLMIENIAHRFRVSKKAASIRCAQLQSLGSEETALLISNK